MGIRTYRPAESYFDRFSRSVGGPTGTPVPGTSPVSATGGTKFTSGDNTYHFYVDDAFAPAPSEDRTFTLSSGNSINVLVIGGGGGAQSDGSGGGGAGGVAHAVNMPVSPGTFTATVGQRGDNNPITNGSSSTFVDPAGPTTLTGLGGGAGRDSNAGSGGGSGGGAGQPNQSGGAGNQPNQNANLPYITNYGNSGGPNPTGDDEGGGGGGAGGAGVPAGSDPTSGDGGAGQPFTFMPGPQLYADMPSPLQSTLGTDWRDALGPTGLMAGGGGGGDDGNATPYGEPGPGGGGNGGPGTPGVNYTGSGGGGGTSSPNTAGGQGGHGIIVVYYPT
jgi:hypothetical protein